MRRPSAPGGTESKRYDAPPQNPTLAVYLLRSLSDIALEPLRVRRLAQHRSQDVRDGREEGALIGRERPVWRQDERAQGVVSRVEPDGDDVLAHGGGVGQPCARRPAGPRPSRGPPLTQGFPPPPLNPHTAG